MYHCILSLASFCFCSIQHLHFTTRVFAHSAVSPFLGCLLVSANETRVCKWKHEPIELPAKPPDYFLRSNKSNINQERDPQIVWLPLHLFAAEPHIASFIWRQGPARRHDFTCSQLSSGEWLFFGNFNECKIVLGENSEIDNCEMVIKIEFRTWNHHNRPKSLSKQLIWREAKLFECRLSANQQWNVFLSVSAIMMISIPCASSDNAPTNKICRRAPVAWLWPERLRTRSCHEREV